MKERRREEKNSKTVQKSDSKREGKLGGERQRERERSIAGERVIEEKELTREFL